MSKTPQNKAFSTVNAQVLLIWNWSHSLSTWIHQHMNASNFPSFVLKWHHTFFVLLWMKRMWKTIWATEAQIRSSKFLSHILKRAVGSCGCGAAVRKHETDWWWIIRGWSVAEVPLTDARWTWSGAAQIYKSLFSLSSSGARGNYVLKERQSWHKC